MDARKERIGEHAAEHALPWAVSALGPVPDDPLARLEWQRRAASIGAYRELSGYDHPADPIGPEPAAAAPDLRAAWHEALAALGPVDGPDVRGMPDGMLLHLRDTYPIETAWAPPWVGDELRQVRAGARDARLAALRADAEADAARRARRARQTPPGSRHWPPATRPCTTPTGNARPRSPRRWRTAPTGTRHPPAAAAGRRRRRRTAPPPPRPALAPAALRRTRARHRSQRAELTLTADEPIREIEPVDQGPGRRAPRIRRPARRPAEPDDPRRRPRLRRPRPGIPRLEGHRTRTRSCSRPSRRSGRPRGSWSAPRDRDADMEAAD